MRDMHGRLTRQILSDPTYVVEIIKSRTADVIDMAYHSLDSYLSHLKTHRDTQLHKETMTGKVVFFSTFARPNNRDGQK